MKKNILICLFLVLSGAAFAQTQAEMTQEAVNDYKKSNLALNEAYKQLKTVCRNDPEFLQHLKNAQMTWVSLRDAQTDMLYPLKPAGGSMVPGERAAYKTEMTDKRTVELKGWADSAAKLYLCEQAGQ